MVNLPDRAHSRVTPVRSFNGAVHMVTRTVSGFYNPDHIMALCLTPQRRCKLSPTVYSKAEPAKEVSLASATWLGGREQVGGNLLSFDAGLL